MGSNPRSNKDTLYAMPTGKDLTLRARSSSMVRGYVPACVWLDCLKLSSLYSCVQLQEHAQLCSCCTADSG
jgi:hypothetical protein